MAKVPLPSIIDPGIQILPEDPGVQNIPETTYLGTKQYRAIVSNVSRNVEDWVRCVPEGFTMGSNKHFKLSDKNFKSNNPDTVFVKKGASSGWATEDSKITGMYKSGGENIPFTSEADTPFPIFEDKNCVYAQGTWDSKKARAICHEEINTLPFKGICWGKYDVNPSLLIQWDATNHQTVISQGATVGGNYKEVTRVPFNGIYFIAVGAGGGGGAGTYDSDKTRVGGSGGGGGAFGLFFVNIKQVYETYGGAHIAVFSGAGGRGTPTAGNSSTYHDPNQYPLLASDGLPGGPTEVWVGCDSAYGGSRCICSLGGGKGGKWNNKTNPAGGDGGSPGSVESGFVGLYRLDYWSGTSGGQGLTVLSSNYGGDGGSFSSSSGTKFGLGSSNLFSPSSFTWTVWDQFEISNAFNGLFQGITNSYRHGIGQHGCSSGRGGGGVSAISIGCKYHESSSWSPDGINSSSSDYSYRVYGLGVGGSGGEYYKNHKGADGTHGGYFVFDVQ